MKNDGCKEGNVDRMRTRSSSKSVRPQKPMSLWNQSGSRKGKGGREGWNGVF